MMLAPITESMVPSALPDWSALSRSARRQAIKWMIGLGYNEDEARMLLNPPKYLRQRRGLNLILPTLWPHRHVGFLQDLQYRPTGHRSGHEIHPANIRPNLQNRCSEGSNSAGMQPSGQHKQFLLTCSTASHAEGHWFDPSRDTANLCRSEA